MTQFVINSLVLACIYAVIAGGYVIVYRASRVLNFAHGDLMILCGYLFFTIGTFGVPIGVASLLALILLIAIALVLYLVVIRSVVGHPVHVVILITIGLSIVIRAVMILIWTTDVTLVSIELGIKDQVVLMLGDAVACSSDLLIVGAAIIYLLVLFAFLRFTKTGAQVRAAAENPLLAALTGVNIYIVLALAWVIAALGAGIGGIVYGIRANLNPESALVGLKVIPVAMVGGMDRLAGVMPAAIIIAFAETAAIRYVDSLLSEAIPMIILLIVLIVRPWGLFGTKEELGRV